MPACDFIGRCLLVTLLFGFALNGRAQEPVLRHYRVEEGLPSSETYDLLQDRKGFLWIATDHGVARYDGYQFDIFTSANGLPDNTIFQLEEDCLGRIWFLSFKGLLSFYEHDSIYPYAFNSRIEALGQNNRVNGFQLDHLNQVWLSCNELIRIDHQGHVTQFSEPPSEGFTAGVYRITDTLLIAYQKRLPASATSKTRYKFPVAIQPGHNRWLLRTPVPKNLYNFPFATTISGSHWVFASGELLMMMDGNTIKHTLKTGKSISGLYIDRLQQVWVYMKNGGVWCVNPTTGTIRFRTLLTHSVDDVLEDRAGNYWFATLEDGLFMFPSTQVYRLNPLLHANDRKVNDLCYQLGYLYFCTAGGNVFRLNPKQPEHVKRISITASASIEYCIADQKGDVWVSNATLTKISPSGKVNTYSTNTTKALFADSDTSVWAAAINGFYKFRNGNVCFNSNQIGFGMRTTAIAKDSSGIIYVGTLNGLYKYNGKQMIYMGHLDQALQKRITHLLFAGNGLWIGTRGGGIIRLYGDSVYTISSGSGLSSDMIKTFLPEADGRTLWVGTNKGLDRVELPNLRITHLDVSNGLPGNEVSDLLLLGETLYVATNNGLAWLNNFPHTKWRRQPLLYLQAVQVNDIRQKNISTLSLAYNQQNLTFEFLGLDLCHAGKVKYAYQLKGADVHWGLTESRSVRYTNLSPGSYLFRLRIAGSNANKEVTLPLYIPPHFTQTWWFGGLVLLGLVLLTAGITYSIIRNERKKNMMQRRYVQSEQKALRSQMNPHFVFNALNSIQSFISENDKNAANLFLSKFSVLMRKILENSRSNFVLLQEEINTLRTYLELEQLRFGKQLQFHIQLQTETPDLRIPSMLIQPFVENAIWHGILPKSGTGNLWIRIREHSSQLICEIEDDGIGRTRSAEINARRHNKHQSTGMRNTSDRIQMLNKLYQLSINVQVEDLYTSGTLTPSGTRVILIFKHSTESLLHEYESIT